MDDLTVAELIGMEMSELPCRCPACQYESLLSLSVLPAATTLAKVRQLVECPECGQAMEVGVEVVRQ